MSRGCTIKYYAFVFYGGEWHRVPFWEKDRVKALRRARGTAREHLTGNATCGWALHTGDGKAVAAGMWTDGIYHAVPQVKLSQYDVPEIE